MQKRNLSNYSDFGNNLLAKKKFEQLMSHNAKAIEDIAEVQLHFTNTQGLLLILIAKTHFHRDKAKGNCSNLKHKHRSSQSF